MRITVHNWDKRQFYKYPAPPWIRLYADLTEHRKTKDLSNQALGLLVRIWIYASKYGPCFELGQYMKLTATDIKALRSLQENNLLSIEENTEFRTESRTESESTLSSLKKIVDHLNHKTGKSYDPSLKGVNENILARLKEGATVEDMILVIDDRCDAWLGDPKMEDYLKPSTIFRPTKYSQYLAEINARSNGSGRRTIFSGRAHHG